MSSWKTENPQKKNLDKTFLFLLLQVPILLLALGSSCELKFWYFFWYFGPSAGISPICECNCGRTIHLPFIGDRLWIFCFLSSTARPHWTCLEFRGGERLPQEEHYRIHLGAIQISSFLDPPPKRPRQQRSAKNERKWWGRSFILKETAWRINFLLCEVEFWDKDLLEYNFM